MQTLPAKTILLALVTGMLSVPGHAKLAIGISPLASNNGSNLIIAHQGGKQKHRHCHIRFRGQQNVRECHTHEHGDRHLHDRG